MVLFALVAALCALLLPGAAAAGTTAPEPRPPAPVAAALPGGKANWVVSVGRLQDTSDAVRPPTWTRLGYYVFGTDGTVSTRYWQWGQADQAPRINAKKADCGGAVPVCDVRTADGFTGAPTGAYRGTYTHTPGGKLTVVWRTGATGAALPRPLTEHWDVTASLAGGDVARITSPTFYPGVQDSPTRPGPVQFPAPGEFSDYEANFGVGYGSNAPLTDQSRTPMGSLATDARYNARHYLGSFVSIGSGKVHREWAGGYFTFSARDGENTANPWKPCPDGGCLGYLQHDTGCKDVNYPDKDRVRYLAETGGGRQNASEYWCQTLTKGAKDCYPANSHVQPMLQVVGDSGRFYGWVGVEASPHVDTRTLQPTEFWTQYYFGIFDQVSYEELRPLIPVRAVVPQAPATDFRLDYGNSNAIGYLRWPRGGGEGPVTYSGRNRPVSGCRYAEFTAYAADGTSVSSTSSQFCADNPNATVRDFAGTLTLPGTNPGPVRRVKVVYWVSDRPGEWRPGPETNCTATGCS
ncbi:hypothetical protein ABZ714_23825 [Streptomyces sp. NPDC006798]|uniref:hypothetical protein n=1 Tax=Streptomyces sp. NPDC006798 TaxID=3155462 RepID=UPI0033E65DA3